MYYEDQQPLPSLLPLNRKKKDAGSLNEGQQSMNMGLNIMNVFQKESKKQPQQEIKKQITEKDQKQAEPRVPVNIQDIKGRFKTTNELVVKKQEKERAKDSDKWKQIQKSKSLIDQILYKINAKNISEQLYPVTNETINSLIKNIDTQISKLMTEQERKQNSYNMNPNNQHLKKELEDLKSSIDRAKTIRQLYNQKIHLRNKIMILEKKIIGLSEENQNLKIKINKGIETIQNHMHNLPCEKQKELKLELDKVQSDWNKEKEMREKLESNVSEIVFNFKRLYEEADTARLIVTRKLSEIQVKQKKMQANTPQNISSEDKMSLKNTSEILNIQDRAKKIRAGQSSYFPSSHSQKTPRKVIHKDSNQLKEPQRNAPHQFSMEEQIRKMRNNQLTIKKAK